MLGVVRRPTIAPTPVGTFFEQHLLLGLVAIAGLAGLVGLVVPATPVDGATAPGGAPRNRLTPTAGPHHAAPVVRGGPNHLTSGWVEVQGRGSGQSFAAGPVRVSPTSSPSLVTATVSTPSGVFLVILGDTSGQPFEAGQVYTTSADITLLVQNGTSTCLNGTGGAGGIKVDQLTHDTFGTITSLAFQFDCFQSATNYFGAVAYNAAPTTPGTGYYLYESTGAITGFGNDDFLTYLGDLSATNLNRPIVGMAVTPDGGGYWLVAADGGVFAYGDARYFGSAGGIPLNRPIVGMAVTADGGGYWLVAADGGIFAYGDAVFHGSMGGRPLNRPIVGITPSPFGYWLVAADGGVFAFDAPFFGSTGARRLNRPVAGMMVGPGGSGYWLVASDGGVFTFGNAEFHGSTGASALSAPVVAMTSSGDGSGYWLAASDGGVFAFDVLYSGSFGGLGVTDVVGIVS